MSRTLFGYKVFASALAAFTLSACADYGYYDGSYSGGGYGGYNDGYYRGGGGGGYRRDYDDDDYDRRRHRRHDNDYDRGRGRDQKMTIEDAQYESVNGKRVDASRYVRDECQGENNCDVKASNKKFGDPDVGAHKDLIVRYRCGRGPTRTVRVPEKSERDIKC